MEIAPAVVRLYARCAEIACEVEQAIDAGEPLEEFLARSGRLLRATRSFLRTGELDPAVEAAADADEAARARTRAAMLAQHCEYRWAKAEIGRLLGLGPGDVNPLDLDLDQECESADDPRIKASERALELRFRLDQKLICTCRERPGDCCCAAEQRG